MQHCVHENNRGGSSFFRRAVTVRTSATEPGSVAVQDQGQNRSRSTFVASCIRHRDACVFHWSPAAVLAMESNWEGKKGVAAS